MGLYIAVIILVCESYLKKNEWHLKINGQILAFKRKKNISECLDMLIHIVQQDYIKK